MSNFVKIVLAVVNMLVFMCCVFGVGYSFYIAEPGMAFTCLLISVLCGVFVARDYKHFTSNDPK